MKDKLESTVLDTVQRYRMIDDDERVLLALSGGADSVALALALRTLGFEVRALHLNHMLRGAESERDEAFVRAFCAAQGMALTVHRIDIRAQAAQRKAGIEETARHVRYALLEAAAQGDKIATAHNANDNTETVLLHLARGSAGRGLCGIPPVRGRIVRPLLHCTRCEIEAYLLARGQAYVTDSTNADIAFARNRIRHEVVPALIEINPALHTAVGRLTDSMRQSEDEADARAALALREAAVQGGYDRQYLLALPPDARGRVVRAICLAGGVRAQALTQTHIHAVAAMLAAEKPNAVVSLPGRLEAVRSYDLVSVLPRERTEQNFEETLAITGFGTFWFRGHKIIVRRAEKNEVFNKSFNTFFVDCGTINSGTLFVRTRKTGDKIRLTQNGGSRTLKRCMIDKKIPLRLRDTLLVLADKDGIIAAEGLGQDVNRTPTGDALAVIQI